MDLMIDKIISIFQDGLNLYELKKVTRYHMFKNGERIKTYNMILDEDYNYKLTLDEARKPIVVKTVKKRATK